MSGSVGNIVGKAYAARQGWAADAGLRATALEAVAAALDARRSEIIGACSEETALTPEELAPEFARMVGTLRMFAATLREGSWVRAAVDGALASGAIGPGHDCRSMLVPLDGVVAVFGASNFPLAYGVCGGDTASAWAAGCPVVVKEHPAHPKTGRLIAEAARTALASVGQPPGLLGYVENTDAKDFGPAQALVMEPRVKAVGFTGSVRGGMALDAAARTRPEPIAVFAEMGSVNVVWVSDGASNCRGREIADTLADSILARFGQQCTRPGLVLCEGDAAELRTRLTERMAAAPGRRMLAPWVRDGYVARLHAVEKRPAVKVLARGSDPAGERGAAAVLLECDARAAAEDPVICAEEIFGPAAVIATGVRTLPQTQALTWTLWAEASEREAMTQVTEHASARGGRVIFCGVPTGVRVCNAMVHGGPYPATNAPGTTAVGPRAMERWCRPVCWQNWPDAALPAALRRANALGISRVVNGVFTREPG